MLDAYLYPKSLMFTQRECLPIFKGLTSIENKVLPLLHQLQPQLFRFLHTQRKLLNLLEHLILQLTGKIANPTSRIDNLLPPILALARNMRR